MKEKYTIKEDGFCAYWFEGNKYRDKVVIYMSGAKCDEKITIKSSQYLREAGYSVLCLGIHMWNGMPNELYNIPVDYVELAVKELKRNGFKNIAIHGVSTGGAYALLCSSLIPDISCTISGVPYDYIMEGMKNDLFPLGFAVYSYQGKSLPYSRYTCVDKGLLNAVKQFFKCKKQKGYTMNHTMRFAYDTSEENEASRIKVENMKSDVLLFAPNYDDCWPSEKAVPRIVRILKEHNYPYRIKVKIYENASHGIGIDDEIFFKNPIKKILIYSKLPNEKKHKQECDFARKDCSQQILNFLYEWKSI